MVGNHTVHEAVELDMDSEPRPQLEEIAWIVVANVTREEAEVTELSSPSTYERLIVTVTKRGSWSSLFPYLLTARLRLGSNRKGTNGMPFGVFSAKICQDVYSRRGISSGGTILVSVSW